MTNLQQGGGPLSGALLRRLWLWLPIAVGGSVALLLGAFVLLPQFLALRADMQRMGELEELQRQSALKRGQLRSAELSLEKATQQQERLFDIVTGNGDLSTFMAMVDREAGLAGVQLQLFEPQTAPPAAAAGARPAAGNPPSQAAQPSPPPGAPGSATPAGPPQIPGLRRETILVSARGPYPALLDFLRRLERLNVLVVQSDLTLQQPEETAAQPGMAGRGPVLKLLLSLYGRPTAPKPPPPPGAVPSAAPASPAMPPSSAPVPAAPSAPTR
ncbi:MAG: hypothetical protein VKN15_00260 [Cyanobacteriota bacterium]|nr:hypothetical protein [Cyanobacteriota bacterium]